MPGGTGSFLANSAQRRRGLNRVREALLDRPGIARQGGPPPPTAPAQDRTSPQEQALAPSEGEAAPETTAEARGRTEPGLTKEEQPVSAIPIDDETRQELLAQIKPFVLQARKVKRAQLHRKIGRVRKFFGGGV